MTTGNMGVKFTLNRRAFREEILEGRGIDLEGALRKALPGDDVEITVSSRMRARVTGRMADEVANGTLSRRLQ